MAHPIVIMSYDKSPAITKAVAALEEAGLEVVVLNTATAKLVNFLGALAGEDPEEEEETPPEEEKAEEKPEEEPPVELAPEEEPPEDLPPEDKPVEEAVVNGEKVLVEMVDGDQLVLHPSEISVSNRTTYKLNESDYSFWPDINETEVIGNVELEYQGQKHLVKAIFSDAATNPPVLKMGKEWINRVDK
jgi:hypothetical protein